MEIAASAWPLIAAAVILAGISKGGFGSSVGFIATPLMALVISPVEAAGIMLPILILMDHVSLAAFWRRWRWATVWPAALAATAGVGLGAAAFGEVDPDALRLGLGIIAILFAGFTLARARGWAPAAGGGRALRAGVWGAASGFTSTISHAGGPPITMYLLGERLDKTGYQASSALIFWAVNLIKLPAYFMAGAMNAASLTVSLWLVPAAVIGVLAGVWLHGRMPERLFFRVMVVALLITGAKLCWDGAAAYWG